jgi:hypothetical protein
MRCIQHDTPSCTICTEELLSLLTEIYHWLGIPEYVSKRSETEMQDMIHDTLCNHDADPHKETDDDD